MYDGWPRLITEDFGPKPDETEGIPANIDTVYFDMRDRNLYFFKGDMVSQMCVWERERGGGGVQQCIKQSYNLRKSIIH